MRLLLVVGPATGGMGAHVASLAAGLPAEGWTVSVFTSPATAARFGLTGERVRTGWRSTPTGLVRSVRALRRMLADVDVVHAHGHQAGLLTVLAARTWPTWPRRRRPVVVVSWHNAVLLGGLRARGLAVAEAVQARGADLVTGASDDLVARAARLGARAPELAEVAAPAAVTDAAATPEPAGNPESAGGPEPAGRTGGRGGPVVLTVSRIAPQKRLDLVVEAAALLAARVPGLTWRVAGDGDEQLLASLRRRAADLDAPVEFLGARCDVPGLLRSASVFALASTWEARALVVQEAMAAGRPVVVPAVGGLPGLLAGTGLLVPPGDAGALADAVHRLLTEPELASWFAEAARRRFADLPTEADVVHTWSARYRTLIR